MEPDFQLMVQVLKALVDGIPKAEMGKHLGLTMKSSHFWTLFNVIDRLKIVDGILMIGPIVQGEQEVDCIVVPASLHEKIFHQLHGSLTSCLFGRERTLHAIQSRYCWPHMKEDIQLWIQSCVACVTRKSQTLAGKEFNAGLLYQRTVH